MAPRRLEADWQLICAWRDPQVSGLGDRQIVNLRWGGRREIIWGRVIDLILEVVSVMGLWDFLEEIASWTCGSAVRSGGWVGRCWEIWDPQYKGW